MAGMKHMQLVALFIATPLTAACIADEDPTYLEDEASAGAHDRDPNEPQSLNAAGDYCVGYTNINRGGTSFTFNWPFDYNDLHRAPSFGDTMSSIECFGTNLVIYQNSQWGGSSLSVSGYISNLASFGMDDKVSSVRWGDSTGSGYCVLWSNTNYSGTSLTINNNVDWNDLHRASPFFGDIASSIDCTGLGFSDHINLCKDDQWGGGCGSFAGDDPDLHNNGYGDNVSSVSWSP